ncbi:MAG: hypothetical protein DGJ47_000084 [Rickettsiaceae bacterium]
MKKLLLTTAAVVALSSSNAFATESDFYVKANGGASMVQKLGSFKKETTGIATIGFGYNVMENLRADLTIDHLFKPTLKGSDNNLTTGNKLELKANSLLVNMYADIYDAGMAKIFVGAGIGAAKISGDLKGVTVATDTIPAKPFKTKVKSKTNFSYALHAGVSAEIDHDMHAELAYSFKDFGKFKNVDKDVRAHNITAGIRFDI